MILKILKKLNIECIFSDNNFTNQKKYFINELIKGNISWENLEKLKISIPYEYNGFKINNPYINGKFAKFINVVNLRGSYDSSIDFFQEFFKFIFKNQNKYIKTNKKNKNINEFIIKIHDDCGGRDSGYIN